MQPDPGDPGLVLNPGPIRVGDVVHGHVGGWFGRDHYDCSRVEAIGADWAVLRSCDDGHVITRGAAGILDALAEARDEEIDWTYHSGGCPHPPGRPGDFPPD